MERVYFSVWGRNTDRLTIASYAVRQYLEHPADAVARSIERSTGLKWAAGPRWDGTAMPEGEDHYQGALGRSLRSGGYSPEAEVWFCVRRRLAPTCDVCGESISGGICCSGCLQGWDLGNDICDDTEMEIA